MSVRFVYLIASVILVVSGSPLPRDFEDNIAEESVNTQLLPKVEEPPYENKYAVFAEGNGHSDHSLHITPVYAQPGIFIDDSQTTAGVTEDETVSTTESNEGTTGIYSNSDEPNNDIEQVNGGVEVGGLEAEHSENLELSDEFEEDSNFESEQIQEEVINETSEGEGSDESIPVEELESDGDSAGSDSGSTIDYGSYDESPEKFDESYEYNPSEGSVETSVREEDLKDVAL